METVILPVRSLPNAVLHYSYLMGKAYKGWSKQAGSNQGLWLVPLQSLDHKAILKTKHTNRWTRVNEGERHDRAVASKPLTRTR
ncbi:hypothetical protein M0804_010081 [Polistes exclamans]|nr:hypothetical protein M0804_010081 [Polistes exclamans]